MRRTDINMTIGYRHINDPPQNIAFVGFFSYILYSLNGNW